MLSQGKPEFWNLRILNISEFMFTTNLLRIIPKFMKNKVVKKRKTSKAGRK